MIRSISGAVVIAILATGCIWNPPNRTDRESTASIPLSGFAANPGETITLKAKNATTGTVVTLGTATASTTAASFAPDMFPWSTTVTPAADFWSPQLPLNGLAHGPGRLEITGTSASGTQLVTFSSAAQTCTSDRMSAGASASSAGAACYDGTSLVVFDNDGVASPAETTGWSQLFHAPDPSVSPTIDVYIGRYVVQGVEIHSLVCRPTTGTSLPLMIINHAGYGINDTTLDQCKNAARQGWVAAASAYRGEVMTFTHAPFTATSTWGKPGIIELCQGEVTDVLRFLTLMRGRGDVDSNRVLMWGHSHGACVTIRALQRGAQVNGAVAFATPTDFAAWHAAVPGIRPQLELLLGATPAAGPQAYAVRSALGTAADLTARSTTKVMLVQGMADTVVPPVQTCNLAQAAWPTSSNWYVGSAPPAACASLGMTWNAGPIPSPWPAGNKFVLTVDVLDHFNIVSNPLVWSQFQSFVTSMGLPSPG